MKKLKKYIAALNNFFLVICMTLFYFLVIGLSALVLKSITLFHNKKEGSSYWADPSVNGWTKERLRSPY